MFTKNNTRSFQTLRDGVEMRTLAWEERTMLCEFMLLKGHTIPSHFHPYEQSGYLLSGKMKFRIGNEWHLAEKGDSWSIPENIEHEVEILEDSVVIELFSPVRVDYLP